MTRVGVYLGSYEDDLSNIYTQLFAWGKYLQDYELDGFGAAELPTAVSQYYNNINLHQRSFSTPFNKIITAYRHCHTYIKKRSPDIVIQLWSYNTHASGIALAGRQAHIPVITRFTGATFQSYCAYKGTKKMGIYILNNIINKYIPLRLSNRMIALGPYGKSQLTNSLLTNTEPIILPPALDQEGRFHPVSDGIDYKKSIGIPTNRPVTLYVGRISRLKGMEFFAEVIERVTERADMLFVLVGEGEYREHFERRFDDDTVRAVGHVPYQEIDQYYKAADLYVHPSQYEGIPLVILEALECGLPVIAREAGDIRFVTDNIVKTSDEMAGLIRSENWNTEWKNRGYFTDSYQHDTLTTLIDGLLD